jgi:hypothetical protein
MLRLPGLRFTKKNLIGTSPINNAAPREIVIVKLGESQPWSMD